MNDQNTLGSEQTRTITVTRNYFAFPGLKQYWADPDIIIQIVATRFAISGADLLVKRRFDKHVKPRQLCAFLMRKHTELSLSQIGRKLAVDHATVLHSIKVINDLKDSKDPVYYSIIKSVEAFCNRNYRSTHMRKQFIPETYSS